MPRKSSFKQSDCSRAAKGFEKAGLRVSGAMIAPDGTIQFTFGDGQSTGGNSFDEIQAR